MLTESSVKFLLLGCAIFAFLACQSIRAQELSQVKELTYNWRGYQVYYKTASPTTRAEGETAAPVIFLHGFGSSSFVWRENLAALAEQRKGVALDLLGFGKSDKPAIEYSPDVWVNLVHEFARANGFLKVALVGNDLGGQDRQTRPR
jgi:pimeloyl-ACP methyl ester carboxylesterase